ncbi:hypothetical protein BHE74_00052705 [Ensete ventricosum]|nr:hypothetical protein BHE74_00052705 [Ensete ventricosum]RZS25031.1 hypothetical protein BHM03_00058187 [Ensete ventricosum]
MAYRRRHSATKSTTFEDFRLEEPPSPLPAQPARASSAYSRSASFTSSSVSAYRDSDRRRRTQIANVMAAKAKLLLRELKTVKADLATAKERCAKLEEENKALRESRQKGDTPADDDLIRLQLETLLAEKARLAHENSIYARENRFLRETVEYHQFTMQEDIVYLDGQGIEEEEAEDEAEAYPIHQMQPFHTPLQSVPEASSSPIPSTPSPSMHSSSELNTTTAETMPSAEGSMQQQQQPYPC